MSTKRKILAKASLLGAALAALPVTAADTPGTTPADQTMTCPQIAAELAPYMQQMMPSAMAMGAAAQGVKERGEERIAEETPAAVALTAAATAAHADPTGIASRAVGQAEAVHQQEVWQRAMAEDKPLADKFEAASRQVAAQGQQLQSNARLQRLMQLAQEKRCDGR